MEVTEAVFPIEVDPLESDLQSIAFEPNEREVFMVGKYIAGDQLA